ncbi:hypothetical protein QUV58_02175 [Succinatimonas hippei]|uniref:hypothetical protein n=1 Tax=Succinatimonas hippei TaxID=626938 RepID=UPI0025A328E7|nr:hypothetical protein [Succinatimonas hippei]MDM8119613.1 hypothetical protein [Succinatimonas hippei]
MLSTNTNIFTNNNSIIIRNIEKQIKFKAENEIKVMSKRQWPTPPRDSLRNLFYQRKMILNTMCFECKDDDEEIKFKSVNSRLIELCDNLINRIIKFNNYLLTNCNDESFDDEYQISAGLKIASVSEEPVLKLRSDNEYSSDFYNINKLINLYYTYSPYESLELVNITLNYGRRTNIMNLNKELMENNKLKTEYECSKIELLENTKFRDYRINEPMNGLICNSCMSIPDILRINDFNAYVKVKCICNENQNGEHYRKISQKKAKEKFIIC